MPPATSPLNPPLDGPEASGPLDAELSRQVHTARLLLLTTDLPVSEVAFAAGYTGERECETAIHQAFGVFARDLRRHATAAPTSGPGDITVRLRHRQPFAAAPLLAFLGARTISGIEECQDATYRRSLHLPRSYGILTATPRHDHVQVRLQLGDVADLGVALQRARRLFDLDADPAAIMAVLGADPLLAPLVTRWPGIRVPGQVDGFELAVRAVLGQQVTVKGARTLAGRLVRKLGAPVDPPVDGITHLFPTADAVADDDLDGIGLTTARVRSLRALAEAVADRRVVLDGSADRDETVSTLLALPGIGPWTAAYVAMRALGDADAIPLTDLGIRHAVRSLGASAEPRHLAALAEGWRPWRAYAALHLWAHLTEPR